MPIARLITWYTLASATLRRRAAAVRATGDRGSHVVEYAIGIGLAAAVVIGLFAAYRNGLRSITDAWNFTSGGGN